MVWLPTLLIAIAELIMKIQQRMQMLILMIWLYMLPITMAESMKIQYICKDQ
jgi:hypothetical protein